MSSGKYLIYINVMYSISQDATDSFDPHGKLLGSNYIFHKGSYTNHVATKGEGGSSKNHNTT